jgi:hypothetical protein
MDIETMLAVLKEIEQDTDKWKLIAAVAVKKVEEFTPLFVPTLKNMVDGFNEHGRGQKLSNFKFWISNGFSREEAMLLTLDSSVSFNTLMKSAFGNKAKVEKQ